MATKTKKKSTTKAKAKAKATPVAATSTRKRHDRETLMPQVVELRDEGGLGWEALAEQLEIDPGLARLLYMTAKVKPKDRIKGDEDEIAAGIVEGREELQQSWGLIAARARLPESKVRKIYEETTGHSHQQGYKVVQERAAAKSADEPKATKSKAKTTDEKRTAAKAKKKATTKARKAKTGSANPS